MLLVVAPELEAVTPVEVDPGTVVEPVTPVEVAAPGVLLVVAPELEAVTPVEVDPGTVVEPVTPVEVAAPGVLLVVAPEPGTFVKPVTEVAPDEVVAVAVKFVLYLHLWFNTDKGQMAIKYLQRLVFLKLLIWLVI